MPKRKNALRYLTSQNGILHDFAIDDFASPLAFSAFLCPLCVSAVYFRVTACRLT